eukprot:CAMPEP_0178819900 /NCGR_PEP_ID=MMETSP0746-20121128/3222_1 /TAXON_ID=913974 /ORGANISM="Nitzschia punctata, Strain CCMP561" /LENGTH=54 /DNA_ID=CAMNT_0020481203 /DNA_START=131 /DNA_END=295 /DNA_ORIENTATION=+
MTELWFGFELAEKKGNDEGSSVVHGSGDTTVSPFVLGRQGVEGGSQSSIAIKVI